MSFNEGRGQGKVQSTGGIGAAVSEALACPPL